jgi:hypothetical protein
LARNIRLNVTNPGVSTITTTYLRVNFTALGDYFVQVVPLPRSSVCSVPFKSGNMVVRNSTNCPVITSSVIPGTNQYTNYDTLGAVVGIIMAIIGSVLAVAMAVFYVRYRRSKKANKEILDDINDEMNIRYEDDPVVEEVTSAAVAKREIEIKQLEREARDLANARNAGMAQQDKLRSQLQAEQEGNFRQQNNWA